MKKNYNWGILAPGKIANKFAQGLSVTQNGKLHAVGSRSFERAKAFAAMHNIPKYYGSYNELLQDGSIDVIYVATPHHLHYEMTKLSLENGKHVLCEKPATINQNQFKELSQLATEKGLFYMEAFWTRFLPSIETCLGLLPRIGPIQFLKAEFCFKAEFDPESRIFNSKLGGGSLLDIGIYPVFLSLLVLGVPDHINASAIIGKTGVDNSMSAIFKYKNGAISNLSSSFMTTTGSGAEIAGQHGRIVLAPRFHIPQSIEIIMEDGTSEKFECSYRKNGYEYEAEELMNCLDQGLTQSPRLPHEFTSKLMMLLDQIRAQINLKYDEDSIF